MLRRMVRASLLVGVFLSAFMALAAVPGGRPKVALAAAALLAGLAAAATRRAPGAGAPPRWFRRAAVALCAAIFLVHARSIIAASALTDAGRTYYGLFDDAMISMRYAWNLTHGLGLVWNPGERVQGFTNPLMVLLMAAPAALLDKAPAVLAVHALGTGLALVSAHLNRRFAELVFAEEEPALRDVAGVAAFAAALLYYPFGYWAIRGMETSLLAVLASGAAVLVVRRAGAAKPQIGLVLLLGAMAWTRPDAALQGAILLAFRALAGPRARRAALVEGAGLAGMIAAGYLAQRAYYGAWVPNTYVLKVTGWPLAARLGDGARFSLAFLRGAWPLIALAVAGVALRFRLRSPVVLALALLASTVAYQAWVGGDAWRYWRIMTPYVPLVAAGALAGALAILRGRARGAAEPVALAVTAAALALADWSFAPELLGTEPPTGAASSLHEIRVAVALSRVLTPEATVGVYLAGTVPYYTGARAIDFLGKSDPVIARLPVRPYVDERGVKSAPGHNKYDLGYSIVKLQPDYVAGFRWGHDDVRWFARQAYERRGDLWLRKGSPNIRWDLLPP